MIRRPRYPIYIPSKGRADAPLTIKCFDRDDLDFHVVVEPSQVAAYERFGRERILVLPEDGRGLVFSRNWIKEHAIASGASRHWQFDDDIRCMRRLYRGHRIPASPAAALSALEDFVDRYENVGLASFNSSFFVPCRGTTRQQWPPFYLNQRCYTCFLVDSNELRFRFRYNEDTDMTLQTIASGRCTILFNAFTIDTPTTMTHGGGQTSIYVQDGRLQMARQLERVWPGVVKVYRRFGRPQHRVAFNWTRFDTRLIRKEGAFDDLPEVDERGMEMVQKKPIRSRTLQQLKREAGGV